MTTPTPATLTTREVAAKVGTDPKTLRTFLRASKDYEAVGSGSRYSFTAKDIAPMKTRFGKWIAEREAAKQAKEEGAKTA
ncbi:hypothetical protein O6072_15910 [Mycolicibacterium neoaurum]|uniref:hypothetical protein n=1 Tax=Mycolicibacterium neoaurum TaxID=1795 RepID=UPI00248D3270|nr:hypothetical protein [Mycolicibacterium neoaurum]WBP92802.1 hypothetical protein O7W24_16590 [Mycolicibacterium neoaurum]WBS06364.1 hypothetical protein O6072_15910 [Mycolicibacterium neoaurum]